MTQSELKLKIVANHPSEISEDESIQIYYTFTNIGEKPIINTRIGVELTSALPSTLKVRHPLYIEHLEPKKSTDSEKFNEKPFINGLMLLTPVGTHQEFKTGIVQLNLYNKENNLVLRGQPISSYKVRSSEEIGQQKEINVALKGMWIAVGAVLIQFILQLVDWYLQYFFTNNA